MAPRRRVILTVNSSIPASRHGIAPDLLDSVEEAVTPMPLADEATGRRARERIRSLWVQTPPTLGTIISPALVQIQQRLPVAGEPHRAGIVKPKLRRVGGVTIPQAILVGAST
jgi:hypothetical protein